MLVRLGRAVMSLCCSLTLDSVLLVYLMSVMLKVTRYVHYVHVVHVFAGC